MYAQELFCEFIGSFILVFIQSAASNMQALQVSAEEGDVLSKVVLGNAAVAAPLGGVMFILGDYSYGHFLTTVTLAYWVRKKIGPLRGITYAICQIAAAFLARYSVTLILGPVQNIEFLLINHLESWHQLFVLEIFSTAVFTVFTLLFFEDGNIGGIRSSGLTLILSVLTIFNQFFGIASINVARSLAAAVFSGQYKLIPIICGGQLLGLLLGALSCAILNSNKHLEEFSQERNRDNNMDTINRVHAVV
jgi:glycerol uptake facilitator-like aquaporin